MHDKKILSCFIWTEASWGGSTPEVQLFTLLYPIFGKKRYLLYFVYLLLTNGAPFPYLV